LTGNDDNRKLPAIVYPKVADDKAQRFLSELFGECAIDMDHEGKPTMRKESLRNFLLSFFGEHDDAAVAAGMSVYAATVVEEDGKNTMFPPEFAPGQGLYLGSFVRVLEAIQSSMPTGFLEEAIAARHFACGGDGKILGQAMKAGYNNLHHLRPAVPWVI